MSDCVYVDSDSCHGTSSYKLSNEKYIEDYHHRLCQSFFH